MAVNTSKVRDGRFWNRWRNSGAVKFNQQNHPEILPGEVWITNTRVENYDEVGWITKQPGKVAYDSLGRPIRYSQWPGAIPVFAQASELADAGVVIGLEL